MSEDIASVNKFHILVIGLGGTGGYLADMLGHLMYADMHSEHPGGLQATFVDGDKVEEVNLLRQNFFNDDLGRNKAQVLADALNDNYGLHIDALPSMIHDASDLTKLVEPDEPVIVVGAVDNNASRAIISEFVSSRPRTIGIDSGNNEKDGQVVVYGDEDLLGYTRLTKALHVDVAKPRIPFDVFPELNDFTNLNAHPDDQSCELHAVHSAQNMGTNMLAATTVYLLIAKLCAGQALMNYVYRFDINIPSIYVYQQPADGGRKD